MKGKYFFSVFASGRTLGILSLHIKLGSRSLMIVAAGQQATVFLCYSHLETR